jgi:hypothetical protein
MATQGYNENFRVLDEFICEAILEPSVPQPTPSGRGVNAGMHVVSESAARESQPPPSSERLANLRGLSTQELLALVHRNGSELRSQDLLVIHEIAAERLGEGERPLSKIAVELSREVMLAAVNKRATPSFGG